MIAAVVLSSRYPVESGRERAPAEKYFKATGIELSVSEALERGWVLALPRTRDMLTARLRKHSFVNLHPGAEKQVSVKISLHS